MGNPMLQMMYPMLAVSAINTIPQVGFGIYDRVNAKRQQEAQLAREELQNQRLAEIYAQLQGGDGNVR
jgi:hypothetical protein